jgi:hypothetical protein
VQSAYTGLAGFVVGGVVGFIEEGPLGVVPYGYAFSRIEDAMRAAPQPLQNLENQQKPAVDLGPLSPEAQKNKITHALPDRKINEPNHKHHNETAANIVKSFDGDRAKAYESIQDSARRAMEEGKLSQNKYGGVEGTINTQHGRIGVYGSIREGLFSLDGITKVP